MTELFAALFTAFGVVFVAELGDKTQLLAMNFGSRFPLRQVALGLAVGYGAASLVAVVVGGLIGARVPERQIQIVGGIVFLVFAVLTLRDDDADDDDADDVDADADDEDGDDAEGGDVGVGDVVPDGVGEPHDHRVDGGSRRTRHAIVRSSVVATIALTILVAEMGDKTQIATATLATQNGLVGTWIGATAGEVASGMIGAVAGTLIGDRIPERALRIAAAVLFAVFGVAMLLGVF